MFSYLSPWTWLVLQRLPFGRQILATRLLPGAAEKWLTLWRIAEKESNTDRETIFHFALDLFFIEFLAPLFPSLGAKSFRHCLEEGKTHVVGEGGGSFSARLLNASDMTDGCGGSHNRLFPCRASCHEVHRHNWKRRLVREGGFKVHDPCTSHGKCRLFAQLSSSLAS